MTADHAAPLPGSHTHVFLGAGHGRAERKTWWAIALTSAMMLGEIVGGSLHMATHALALLIAALAYTYARTHAESPQFAFGTGKLGDLAGYTSAIVLGMIALLILYEAVRRFLAPVSIHFAEAIPIAVAGLCVNVATAWLLSGGHGHSHSHSHHDPGHGDETRRIDTGHGTLLLEIFEDGVPPRFRIRPEPAAQPAQLPHSGEVSVETSRSDGTLQRFAFTAHNGYLESVDVIPEPHAFTARLSFGHDDHRHDHHLLFTEHEHGPATVDRDNNLRAAFVHVLADAAVSVLAIAGLLMARGFGWVWMDPAMGIVGALVIANWAWGLARDTGGVLTDMTPDQGMAQRLRDTLEADGDRVTDLHLWRLGPGHLGAIVSVVTEQLRGPDFYRTRLARFPLLSHVTVEVRPG
jgi:cation diffusion facilitator family transporter